MALGLSTTNHCLPHGLIAAVLLCLTPLLHASETASYGEGLGKVFQQSCVQCHGENGKVKGDVNLLEITSEEQLLEDPELLQLILDVIDFEEMPPDSADPIEPKLRDQTLASLQSLFEASLAESKVYAHTPIRRMNRFQFNNAVTDLLGLNCVVFTLPERIMRDNGGYFQPATGQMPEHVRVGSRPLGKSQLIEKRLAGVGAFPQDLRAEHGYDNQADHLSLSPLLMESFLKVSQSIVDSPDFGPKTCGIWKEFFVAPEAPDSLAYATRHRLESFLHRAFRSPVEAATIDRYTNYVLARVEEGEAYPAAMKAAVAAVLASPRFLYLYDETPPEDGSSPLDSYELASRLSFFLWGSIPDDQLLKRAQAGTLTDPEVLATEVDRMLIDPKLKRFCDSFPSQWLQLDRIISSIPDREQFPDFYFSKYRMSMHMMLEPLLLFETVLVEDRPVVDLIDPDFTYRSNLLKRAYGEKAPGKNEVTALNFYRQPITDRREGGVITNAAILTMTSGPNRTQPITRGAWLAGVIFNNPPEPPPADVPPLPEHSKADENLTLRERLLAHRERADCAGCHEQIDPLGFALENYGPTGKWRTIYENGREVDMTGKLFRKHEFTDVIEFKDAIMAEKDRFTRAFAGHLLAFSLARELDATDAPALDLIANATIEDGYRMKSLLKEVIFSEPFLSKSTPEPATAEVASH